MATTARKPAKEAGSASVIASKVVLVAITSPLLEPLNQIRFSVGVPVEVAEVTGWMQSQLDAGLLRRV